MKTTVNKLKTALSLLVVVLAVVAIFVVMAMPPRKQGPPVYESTEGLPNLLRNSSFEGGWHLETTYWTSEGGPFHNQYQEITPPTSWVAWWREGFLCSGTSNWVTGRPEVRVISAIPDPERIRSGEQATQWLTFWRCHGGGLYQQVAVEPGKYYTLRAYGHSWFSNCDHRPHDGPYDYDCTTPIDWAQNWLSVGIDPTGGTDPKASTVEWSTRKQIYGKFAGPLAIDFVLAVSDTLTVFLWSEASHPLKHDDVSWDDVVLYDTTYRVYLPIIGGTND